jgi:hypothetical protein
MSSERPEFRPIETAPARKLWPYAALGAALVAGLLYVGKRNAAAAPAQTAVLGNVAAKAEVKAPEPAAAAKPAEEKPKPAAGPNVLGGAVAAAKTVAMVARAELDREIGRTQSAQKQSAAYKKQIADLEKQLADAHAQLAAIAKAKQPPPPSDQEQILQMLAPVLRSSNDGRP